MDLNKVMIIGRLTKDPEAKMTPQGQNVASFSLATNRSWKDANGNKKDKPEYHNIVAWRKLAEICGQYLRKGSQVYIEGYLQTRSWQDQNGTTKYRTEVVAENMIMLGGRPSDSPRPATNNAAAQGAMNGRTAFEQMQNDGQQGQQEPPTIQVDAPDNNEIKIEDIPF